MGEESVQPGQLLHLDEMDNASEDGIALCAPAARKLALLDDLARFPDAQHQLRTACRAAQQVQLFTFHEKNPRVKTLKVALRPDNYYLMPY